MSGGFPACAVATGRWRAGLAAPAIAAPLIAASVLAPAGVTATIQADPVCLPVTAQPGHSYALTVYVVRQRPLTLAVTPAHGSLERTPAPAAGVVGALRREPGRPGQVALHPGRPGRCRAGRLLERRRRRPRSPARARRLARGRRDDGHRASRSARPRPRRPVRRAGPGAVHRQVPAVADGAFATTTWKQALERDDRPEEATAPTAEPVPQTRPQAPGHRARRPGSRLQSRDAAPRGSCRRSPPTGPATWSSARDPARARGPAEAAQVMSGYGRRSAAAAARRRRDPGRPAGRLRERRRPWGRATARQEARAAAGRDATRWPGALASPALTRASITGWPAGAGPRDRRWDRRLLQHRPPAVRVACLCRHRLQAHQRPEGRACHLVAEHLSGLLPRGAAVRAGGDRHRAARLPVDRVGLGCCRAAPGCPLQRRG